MTRPRPAPDRPLSRRALLRWGAGATLLAACGGGRRAVASADARLPTPAVVDDDDHDDLPAIAAAPACSAPTADNIEGPFFKAGAPHRAVLVADGDPGERLIVGGRVLSTDCAGLGDVELEIWQADARGDYDLDGYRYRGALRTAADGAWRVTTVVPGRYLNGSRYRPAHLHVKLRAAGHRPLTTQLYFAGDPYNDGDPFIVPSLIMPHRVERGVRRAGFDFVLEPA
ncbi:MAG: dioxygenase [Kofleriaceae bacterium]|nr:dioxygenase [Kofleriaceae bacterium]